MNTESERQRLGEYTLPGSWGWCMFFCIIFVDSCYLNAFVGTPSPPWGQDSHLPRIFGVSIFGPTSPSISCSWVPPPHPAPRGDGWWCRMGLGWGCSGRFFLERLSCCGDKLEAIWKSKSITAHCQASLIASLSAFNCNELYGSARWGAEPLGWNLCNSRKCLHKSQVNVKLPTDFSIHEPLFVFGFRDRQRKSRACVCLCELHELKDTKRKKDRELSLEQVLQWPDSFP